MNPKNSIIVALLTLFLSKSIAQNHTNSWFRTTLDIPFSKKIKTDFELQHRRQNNFGNYNPFDKELFYTFRTWLYYKQAKNIVYGLSPFAYFSHHRIIRKAADANIPSFSEYRFSASVELQNELASKFSIINRAALEYRIFEEKMNMEDIIRFRNRLSFKYYFNRTFDVAIGEEVFINASGTDALHIFDHNRLSASMGFSPTPALKFDMGYIHISRLIQNNIDLLEENNFYLNFTYTLQRKR